MLLAIIKTIQIILHVLSSNLKKIKRQSIACYYTKDNPHGRQYKFSYAIIHDGDDVLEVSAINGKLIYIFNI